MWGKRKRIFILSYWETYVAICLLPIHILGLPPWLSGKESACQWRRLAGDKGSISGPGRSPGGNGNPRQYSWLENSMDRGTWRATVHGVTKTQTWLSAWAHTWWWRLSRSVVSGSWDPMDGSPPGSSVHGVSRQEYWSGLPCPPLRNCPNPGIEPSSPKLQVDSLPSEPSGGLVRVITNIC